MLKHLLRSSFLLLFLFIFCISSKAQRQIGDYPFHYGFKIGYNLALERDYSTVPGDRTRAGYFGLWAEYGEPFFVHSGVQFLIQKRYFLNDTTHLAGMLETRYVQIPIGGGLNIPLNKQHALRLKAGGVYQQLLKVSINNVGYSMSNITKSHFNLFCGVGYRYRFVTLELNYLHFLRNFDTISPKSKEKYLEMALLFSF